MGFEPGEAVGQPAWIQAAEWMALWPISAFTAWTILGCTAIHAHRHLSRRCSHDLPVPERIEEEGEHGLFA